MTKGWRPSAKRLSVDGKIEIARAPTEDEEWALYHQLVDCWTADADASHKLAEFLRSKGMSEDDISTACGMAGGSKMDAKLRGTLRQFLEWHIVQRPWSPKRIKLFRWFFVRLGIDAFHLPVGNACKFASMRCEGTPAAGGQKSMEAAHYEIENIRGSSRGKNFKGTDTVVDRRLRSRCTEALNRAIQEGQAKPAAKRHPNFSTEIRKRRD
jgi:hypothetical protein